MATHVRLAMAVGIAALLCGFASVAVEGAAACDSGCPAVLSVLPSLVALQDSPAQVTITGTNLGAAVAVYIEPDNVIVPSTVLGATQVVVMIPASTPDGAYWFVVQTADWASREDPPVVVRVLHTQALATPDPSTSS